MIRNANENDARAISKIRINGWKNAYRGIVSDEYLDSIDDEKDYKRVYSRILGKDKDYNPITIVFVDDITNEVLGFSSFGEVITLNDNMYDCELYAIYVKPENKGQGIGKQMLVYINDYLKSIGKKEMILFCLKDNLLSRNFYETNGGIEVEEIEKQIGNQKLKQVGYKFEL